MKVLTAEEMREVDRRTIESGIPGLILMENAGCRVVDFLREQFAPLSEQRVLIVCGKGNNGGDGFVAARQLFTRRLCRELTVVELFDSADLTGDAAANRRMLEVCACPVARGFPPQAEFATVVVDAILGTGVSGALKPGPALDAIRRLNTGFPLAKRVAVDLPSGMPSEEFVRTDFTVTFVSAKRTQALKNVGELTVAQIGTPAAFCETNSSFLLNLTTPRRSSPFVRSTPYRQQ